MQLAESQGYRCRLTGMQLEPGTAGIDHIVPLSRGGENSIANCQMIHSEVNRAKGLMTNDEFIEMCRKVAAHNP